MAQNNAVRPPLGAAAAVLWLLSGFWFLDSYNSAPDEFSLYDKIYAVCWVAAVLAAQTFVALAFYVCRAPAFAVNLLFACFAAVNIYSLNLILVDGFYGLHGAAQLLILAAGGGMACAVFSSLREFRWKAGALAASALLFGWSFISAAAYEWRHYMLLNEKPAVSPPGEMTSAPGIKIPVFTDTPNVYFIAFDGLLARTLARQYFSSGEPPYYEALKRHGFQIFKNHFSPSPDTRRTFNKFAALDAEFYYSLGQTKRDGMAAGRAPAPLYEIFKANGYTVYFNNFNSYLGFKGPHIDRYVIPRVFSACTFMRDNRSLYVFFTFCPLLTLASETGFLNFHGARFRAHGGYQESDLQAMLDMYSHSARRKERGMFLSYVFWPEHIQPPYHFLNRVTHRAYVRRFADGADMAAHAINEIIRFIERLDRRAIVYMFGDHGPWFSYGLDWNSAGGELQKFIIHDRYGVTGALYPAGVCSEYFPKPSAAEYITPPEVARRIIRCLAGGEDPFVHPVKYQLDYDEKGYRGKEKGDYADYLYE